LSAHADVGLVLVVEEAANRRLAVAFDELALVRALRALGQAGGRALGGPPGGYEFSTSRITLMAEEYGEAKFLSK
jgi:hypothetical protein